VVNFGGIATAGIPFNATIAQVQAALDTVLGAGNTLVDSPVAGTFQVTFQGVLANANVEQFTNATGATLTLNTTTQGVGGVSVASGAALELDNNINISGETVAIAGTGIINGSINALVTGVTGTGALRSVSGTNTWAGSVVLIGAAGANVSTAVDAGSLTINGNIYQQVASVGLMKTGAGTLEMTGAQENTYGGSTFVNQGTLVLNKAGASRAIRGTLHVGDNLGGSGADVVQYAPTAGTNQIGDVAVLVHSTGLLDLNGISDSVNSTLTIGLDRTQAACCAREGDLTR
jgi:autotransporter-associated beta strand protein